MAVTAEQNGLSGQKPKAIGRGYSNYNVDFSPDKESKGNVTIYGIPQAK